MPDIDDIEEDDVLDEPPDVSVDDWPWFCDVPELPPVGELDEPDDPQADTTRAKAAAPAMAATRSRRTCMRNLLR
jgi:hypothetical protein